MTDHDLIRKFNSLKSIIPDADFADTSRALITETQTETINSAIVSRLEALRSITPDANFAFQARLAIMESKAVRKKFMEIFSPKNILNSGLALGLGAVLLTVIAGGKSYLFPSSSVSFDERAILAEAATIQKDIDIHLRQVEFYSAAAEKTTVALNDASENGYGHVNKTVIQKEAMSIDVKSPVNSDIDKLLYEATF